MLKRKKQSHKLGKNDCRARNNSERVIYVVVIHGCGIGYKCYARNQVCQRKSESVQC